MKKVLVVCFVFTMSLIACSGLFPASCLPPNVIISGSTISVTAPGNPISGVEMEGFPGELFVVTDSSGNYRAEVPYGWSGTVRPVKAGFTFTPASTTYTNIRSNQVTNYYSGYKTITASASSGGSISPSGVVAVNYGNSQTFTITPNAGYKIVNVVVDGSSVGVVSTYTFWNVTANHTISASFDILKTYTLTVSAGPGGFISPSGIVTVNEGTSLGFTIIPNTGYYIDTFYVDGVPTTNYTLQNINANHTVYVTFSRKTYQITAYSSTGGTVSPMGTSWVYYGDSKTYYIYPYSGYRIEAVYVDGLNVGARSFYTFSNINSNHSIRATFVQN
jgi:hypothetical protein